MNLFVFIEGFQLVHEHAPCLIMRRQNLFLQSAFPTEFFLNNNFNSLVNNNFVSST